MTANIEQHLWVERYRPKTIKDCALPKRLKDYFQSMVDSGNIEHLMCCGTAGVGKTSVARALCNELNMDTLIINCSENGNIDTLRTTIRDFASTISLMGNTKCVILDECDGLTNTCFSYDQKVLVINEHGEEELVCIGDIAGQEKPFTFLSMLSDGTVIQTNGIPFMSGVKDVYEYTFDDGTTIQCTEDHVFFDADMNEVTLDVGVEVKSR